MSKELSNLTNHIDFLHIGKCAGNQIDNLLSQISNMRDFTFTHNWHDVKLRHIALGNPYFFSIRNPITRFFSGFYSRKRKGRPKFDVPWSNHDAKAFAFFPHANDIAESLFESDFSGKMARYAVNSIDHLRNHQIEWFEDRGYFLDLQPPVWIIRVEYFEHDFNNLLRALDIGIEIKDLDVSNDPIQIHKNDYGDSIPLSTKAIQNLEHWYLRDFYFYDSCEDWLTHRESYLDPSN